MSLAIIDSDIIAYRCAATSENDEAAIAKFRCDDMMHNILNTQQVEYQVGFLTGRGNFRKILFPDYKANRKGKEKPKHLQLCRDHLQNEWKATVVDGMEADDAIGIASYEAKMSHVICSIDKDLQMLEGNHYNFVKDLNTFVGGYQAAKNFWVQMLVGDTSDNIAGVRGIGPVKAEKHLAEGKNDAEWFEIVRRLYADDQRMLLNCNLLWIWRQKGELWTIKHVDLLQENMLILAKEQEQKFLQSTETTSLPDGLMESDGTSPNTTLTGATV